MEVFEERRLRKNGETAYVNVPQKFLEAMNLSWEEFLKARVIFKIQNGNAIIEMEKRK